MNANNTSAQPSQPNRTGQLDHGIIGALLLNTDPYLSCDDCFDQVDAAVEALVSHGQVLSAAFRAHLAGCPACYDEALALAGLIAPELGESEADAVQRLQQHVTDPA